MLSPRLNAVLEGALLDIALSWTLDSALFNTALSRTNSPQLNSELDSTQLQLDSSAMSWTALNFDPVK